MASLHARTQIRPFGQVDNCVDCREFIWYITLEYYVEDAVIAGPEISSEVLWYMLSIAGMTGNRNVLFVKYHAKIASMTRAYIQM